MCQGVLKHLPTFTPVSGVSGVSGVFLVIQQMIGGIGKKGVAADLAVQCKCCLFSAQLCLLLCPSMHVTTDGYLEELL